MQTKIGTILDESLIQRAKKVASLRHTTLSHIFSNALSEYLSIHESKRKLSQVEASFNSISLSRRIVNKIVEEDIY